jgi:hypothetical protein
MLPATINTTPASRTERRGRRRAGCTLGCLSALIILILVIGAGWVFAVRPYLHNIAQTQLDQAMSAAVDQIPPQAAQLPPGPIAVQENAVNNLIVLNLAPSDPVQHPNTLIDPSGVHLSFQLYNQPCTISLVPQAVNGKIVASNVTVSGIIGLVMSPQEITATLNKHLADAQARLQHSIKGVTLKEHEMDVILG